MNGSGLFNITLLCLPLTDPMLCLVQVARGLQQQESLDAFRLALFMVMLSGGATHTVCLCVCGGGRGCYMLSARSCERFHLRRLPLALFVVMLSGGLRKRGHLQQHVVVCEGVNTAHAIASNPLRCCLAPRKM